MQIDERERERDSILVDPRRIGLKMTVGMHEVIGILTNSFHVYHIYRNDRFDTLDYLTLRLYRFACLLHCWDHVKIKVGVSIPVDPRRIQGLKMTAGFG